MSSTSVSHAHISVPADCLPLVAELITRLGGRIVGNDAGIYPELPMPEVPRGGKMLRALRQRAGMTQKALAGAIGVPQSHISEFEQDKRAVPYKHAQKLAKLLHSIPSHFMTPNAETIAAMNDAELENPRVYRSPEEMYKDLGI